MSSPKEYYLIQQEGNYYIAQTFAREVLTDLNYQALTSVSSTLESTVFYLKGQVNFSKQAAASLSLYDDELRILLHKTENSIKIELIRRYQGEEARMQETFPHHYQINEKLNGDQFDFELLVDNGLTEFHFASGRISISQLAFPKILKTTPHFSGDWENLSFAMIQA